MKTETIKDLKIIFEGKLKSLSTKSEASEVFLFFIGKMTEKQLERLLHKCRMCAEFSDLKNRKGEKKAKSIMKNKLKLSRQNNNIFCKECAESEEIVMQMRDIK